MILIETKSRTNAISWIVYSLFGAFLLLGPLVALVILLVKNPTELLTVLPVALLQFFIGLLCLRMVLWFSRGKEWVELRDNQLHFKKSGTFWLRKERIFEIDKIKNITLNRTFIEANSPSQAVHDFSRNTYIFRIQNTGRIKVVYEGFSAFYFLDNLEIFEAEELLRKICEQVVFKE